MKKQIKTKLRTGSSLMAGLAILTLMFVGCDNVTSPQQTESFSPPISPPDVSVLNSELDASYYTVDGFYFLPPMVSSAEYSGTFDPDLSPVVEICETPACDALHASFDMDGEGSERVRVDQEDEHYFVIWKTNSSGAEAGQTYRIRVSVDGFILGHANVHVVRNGREANEYRAAGEIAIVAKQTLQVKFRIEEGAVSETGPVVTTISVSPAEVTIAQGSSSQFVATIFDQDGEVMEDETVSWSSSDSFIASVDEAGLATAISAGQTTIIASIGGVSGSATITVEAQLPVVDRIEVSPAIATINTGATQQFVATVYDQYDEVMEDETVSWSSGDTSIASVDETGLGTGNSEGATTIIASIGEASGSAILTVIVGEELVASSIEVTPFQTSLNRNDIQQLTATVLDQNGGILIQDADVTWSSKNPCVASVNSFGIVTGLSGGEATIEASYEGLTGTANINVENAAAGSPANYQGDWIVCDEWSGELRLTLHLIQEEGSSEVTGTVTLVEGFQTGPLQPTSDSGIQFIWEALIQGGTRTFSIFNVIPLTHDLLEGRYNDRFRLSTNDVLIVRLPG